MKTQSPDTHPEIEKFQISLFQSVSGARRFSIARSLSRRMISLSRRAIRRSHPNISELELKIAYVGFQYGKELADRLRAYLVEKRI